MKDTISDIVERLAHGVEPVQGEPLVFFVQSKSRAGVKHRVDFNEFSPNGSCTCEDFLNFGRMESRLRHGSQMGPATQCEHIRRAGTYVRLVTISNLAKALEAGHRDAVETMLEAHEHEPESSSPW